MSITTTTTYTTTATEAMSEALRAAQWAAAETAMETGDLSEAIHVALELFELTYDDLANANRLSESAARCGRADGRTTLLASLGDALAVA
jgi:hypothetical protein